jgi:hypothetical protein
MAENSNKLQIYMAKISMKKETLLERRLLVVKYLFREGNCAVCYFSHDITVGEVAAEARRSISLLEMEVVQDLVFKVLTVVTMQSTVSWIPVSCISKVDVSEEYISSDHIVEE